MDEKQKRPADHAYPWWALDNWQVVALVVGMAFWAVCRPDPWGWLDRQVASWKEERQREAMREEIRKDAPLNAAASAAQAAATLDEINQKLGRLGR